MNAIKAKRGYAKGSLTRAESFAASINQETPISLIEIRFAKLNEVWSDFLELNKQLCEFCDDPEFVDSQSEFEEYETKFFLTHSTFTKALRERKASDAPDISNTLVDKLISQQTTFLDSLNSSSTERVKAASVNLPKINIPEFSGEYKDWPEFKDIFTATIDSNKSLTAAQKFKYLKSCLAGSAKKVIRFMNISDNNYLEAWDRLESRFDKTHLTVQSFVQSFHALPPANPGNVMMLRQLTDGADEILRGLNALEANSRDPWLIHLLLQKVDQEAKQAWAEHVGTRDDISIHNLIDFLETRCNCLESCNSFARAPQPRSKAQASIRSHLVESKPNCPKCREYHTLPHCKQFSALDINARREFVKQQSLCFNCLHKGHNSGKCRSTFRCRMCNARHHSLVHPTHSSTNEPSTSTAVPPDINCSSDNFHTIVSNHSLESTRHYQTFLPTATVQIQDKQGSFQNLRLLFDTGSQVSFITERAAQRLGLKRKPARIPITGIASTSAGVTNGLVSLKLHSRFNDQFIDIECYVISKLTSLLPSSTIASLNTNRIWPIQLADPDFNKPSPVDILVGSDKVFSVITGPIQPATNDFPDTIPTIFGQVIAGRLALTPQILNGGLQSYCTELDFALGFDLERFWRLEDVSSQPILGVEEQQAEDHFASTHSRHSDGRFVVELPFKQNQDLNFGNSFQIALSRLQSIERRFASNPEFQKQYSNFIQEYQSLGHMEEIPFNEISHTPCYYLPHHAVLKTDSTTTKIRVVFDASAKTTSFPSLNDCLLVGPTIQRDIFSICLRFRRHVYTISGDIEKMYRQIWVSPKHTNFQRILWRETPESKVKHYRLLTVTYGTSSAPFLAVRSLKQVALDSIDNHPVAAEVILNDFYVDDVITGADTIGELSNLYAELVELLKSAGFHLRKWTTNCWPLLLSLPEEQREISPIDFEDSNAVKVLGLLWCPSQDCFSYRVRLDTTTNITKRRILSEASRIFDPIGFVAPVVVSVKILLQDLWKEKINWDEQIPEELARRWTRIHQELHILESLRIARPMWSNKQNWEFHGFCDASLDAYAAAVYCRSINMDGSISVTLVSAKSKVAPIKTISLPRLELCGALLLTRLINKIKISLQQDQIKLFAWTDSSIVLHWLSAPPKRWSVFVGNRTSEILSSMPRKLWNHVRSASNPADVASRGINPSLLSSLKIWWNGPEWLWLKADQWPGSNADVEIFTSEQLEERSIAKSKVFVSNINATNILETLLHNSSSWSKCYRIVAYLFRALPKRRRLATGYHTLTTKELLNAKTHLVKSAQCSLFAFEIDRIKRGKILPKRNKLVSLSPFLDSFGVLRVGGRLQNSELSYNEKHPIILCKSHPISKLIAQFIHKHHLHAGASLTFSIISQNFYILGCRNLLRKLVHDCVVCFRQRLTASTQLMGNLPKERIRFCRPFSKVGCDYAGPITLRLNRGRNPKFVKAYISLFVCFVTKGIHLELVGDLSSDAFLLALDRFVARRGKPMEIWSDNGTNFHGAKRVLGEMFDLIRSQQYNTIVSEHLSRDNITWKFIPPSAPHFGGLWEAGIRSVKMHLKRVIGDNKLTYEEMYTLLTKIECLLNSRPMWQTADGEPSALSPSHFMIGESYTSVPQPDVSNLNYSLKTNWYALQVLLQGFWKRWHKDYLTSLQQRPKWQNVQPNLNVNDVVLLNEPNLPPSKWILGRIIKVHPGTDNNVRVVTVRTKHGNYLRPIAKVAPLPFAERPEPFRGG